MLPCGYVPWLYLPLGRHLRGKAMEESEITREREFFGFMSLSAEWDVFYLGRRTGLEVGGVILSCAPIFVIHFPPSFQPVPNDGARSCSGWVDDGSRP
ncbi:hypothetical protein M413DRAFT_239562 [Hebeloma cylindrosporum]|uniref:Uncharacterized protein n=1 Tax=Hebeloma cylindrosporum TaxID=76867 RepID=A0A0C3BQM2_HEBCY|nr:hypothetical protein M413DRAFT_239562 [Hebeloma cylindrosporum h7]